MEDQLKTRLQELQAEYQKGQERLAALEQEMAAVKTSMLRISGAIQVLEELLNNTTTKESISAEERVSPNGIEA